MAKGNVIMAYGGGPTCVINETAIAAGRTFSQSSQVGDIWVMAHGIDAIKTRNCYDFKKETQQSLDKIASTICAAAGSTRTKPTKVPGLINKTFDTFKRNNVRYFLYIGGNDTAEATNEINNAARARDYELSCVHAVKTIDNDVVLNHRCPGFGSAGAYVAFATLGSGLEIEAINGIFINVVMGRHTGYLAGSSALTKHSPDDAPHLIYFPERPISGVEEIINDIKQVHHRLGRCCITLSEGTKVSLNGKNEPLLDALIDYLKPRGIELKIKPNLMGEIFKTDNFGNPELSSYSLLGDFLSMALQLEPDLRKTRIRAQTLGYNQRAFALSKDPKDASEAKSVGIAAARHALSEGDTDGSIALVQSSSKDFCETKVVSLEDVAGKTKLMSDEFIGEDGKSVTPKFIEYASSSIATKIPKPGRFSHPIKLK